MEKTTDDILSKFTQEEIKEIKKSIKADQKQNDDVSDKEIKEWALKSALKK